MTDRDYGAVLAHEEMERLRAERVRILADDTLSRRARARRLDEIDDALKCLEHWS